MSLYQQHTPAVLACAGGGGGLLQSIGMAGSAAVITVTFIHPIDVIKTRIQISTEYSSIGMVGSTRKIIAGEGVGALWKGVNAAWLREASYTSLRLGLYEPCKIAFGCTTPETTTFVKKFLAGSAAGALGSVAGNPFDVLKTKMMAAQGAGASLTATAKELFANQGLAGFYRGIDSNIARAMVLNGTKMGVYDQAKGLVVDSTGWERSSLLTTFFAATTAGFFMTCTVSPFDMIRTRLMNQPNDARIYNNAVDCMIKIATKEGPLTFWRGFMPIWSRFAPTTTLQLVIFEQLRALVGMKSL